LLLRCHLLGLLSLALLFDKLHDALSLLSHLDSFDFRTGSRP
jgi:hypothetical protein